MGIPLQKKRTIYILKNIVLILCLGVFLFSCAQDELEILSVESRIRFSYDPSGKGIQQFFSVHFEVENRDIAESVQELRMLADTSSFTWEVESGKLQIMTIDSRVFIGTNAMSQPEGILFPEGDYRIEIITGQGNRAESLLTFPRAELFSGVWDNPGNWFPSITEQPDKSLVLFGGEKFLIRRYNSSGSYVDAFYLNTLIIKPDTKTYLMLKEYEFIEISVFNHTVGAELTTGPIQL